MIWPFPKKKPREPWVYLGYTILKWSNARDDYVHFYGRGERFCDRKVDTTAKDKGHPYYQQFVRPWLEDSKQNVWDPIQNPSQVFKNWTKADCGFERVEGKWVKPAPPIEKEGNVIQFTVAK